MPTMVTCTLPCRKTQTLPPPCGEGRVGVSQNLRVNWAKVGVMKTAGHEARPSLCDVATDGLQRKPGREPAAPRPAYRCRSRDPNRPKQCIPVGSGCRLHRDLRQTDTGCFQS